MTVGSLLGGGFRLIKERGGALLIWTLIQLVVTVGTSFAMAALLRGTMDAVVSGTSPESAQLSYAMQALLVGIVGLIVSAILYTAAMRAVLRPAEGGPGWLGLGMDEVRQFLLILLYVVIFSVVTAVLGAILVAIAGAAAEGTLVTVLTVFGLLVAFALGVKLSLTFPLTLKRRAFAVGDGWRLTNGHFWTLFGAFFIISLIVIALGALTMVVTEPDYIAAIMEHGFLSPEAEQASLAQYERLMLGTIDAPIIITWVLTAIQGAITYALAGGAAATAVQQLDGAEEGLSETFS